MAKTPVLSGWGGAWAPGRESIGEDLAALTQGAVLTRGLGRSYGDASLPPPGVESVAGSRLADRILAFDPESGVMRAEAGLTLGAIQRVFLPRRWTFPVLPGTQFVTLGGAVAADIHGKNHHVDGTLGNHVTRLLLRLADESIVECSRQTRPDLFRATLGGMGLTGHILEVDVRLQQVPSSWIWSESERIAGIEEFIAKLRAAAQEWPFTVGWMDTLARGEDLGRGLLIRGRWADPAKAPTRPPQPLSRFTVPFHLPGWLLNRTSMALFNRLYYLKHPRSTKSGIVHPESFFHPLDAVRAWNKIYGRRGFTQHQCVLPENENPGATQRYLEHLATSRLGSFLCVIKDCGPEGEGTLSFPRHGITIAADLPIRRRTQQVIDQLNERVIEEGGRIYLAKDTLTRGEHFRAMEPRLEVFERARRRWDPDGLLGSAQSVRLLDSTPGETTT